MVTADPSLSLPTRAASRLRLAVLDDVLAAKLEHASDRARDVELIWAGVDAGDLRRQAPAVDVLVVHIDRLVAPLVELPKLAKLTGAKLSLALYAFAKRELIERIGQLERVRTLRTPMSLSVLRTQMIELSGQQLLRAAGRGPRPPRYSALDLARLQQISTQVECECPNHLATLLQSLVDFENYSKSCENRSPADAETHRLLYETTARARNLMEGAMDELLEREQLSL